MKINAIVVLSVVAVLLLLIFSRSGFAQSDPDYRKFTSAIHELVEVGRDVYELGFNDGIQCMILIQLKYKYGGEPVPALKDMADMCRLKWSVEDRE